MCSITVKMNYLKFLFFAICLAVAIDAKSQNFMARRLSRRSSYAVSPYCRECEHDCRERDRYSERERTGIDSICARRVFDGEMKTFESLCLLKCHNDCYHEESQEYRVVDDRECRIQAKIVHDNADHSSIPTCSKSRECYCGTICQPICARSPDPVPMYAIFDNPCRLSCTNRCFDEGRGYEPTEAHLCREEFHQHRCQFGLKG